MEGGPTLRFHADTTPNASTDPTEPLCLDCLKTEDQVLYFEDLATQAVTRGRVPPSEGVRKQTGRREQAFADRIGARVQPGSGSQAGYKGDIRLKGLWRGELKNSIRAASFQLTRALLQKIESEAQYPEKPVFGFEFLSPGHGKPQGSYVIITMDDWEELTRDEPATRKTRRPR